MGVLESLLRKLDSCLKRIQHYIIAHLRNTAKYTYLWNEYDFVLLCLQDTESLQSDHGIPNLSNGAGKIIAPKAAIYELDNFSQDTPQRELRRQKSGPSRQTSVDDLDKTSVYSFFMEKDFRYYFQHPYLRLAVAYLVTFCNFLIYAEDPVAHSESECFIPVVGNTFSFVITKYPKNAWAVLKVIMWLIAILVGLVVGRQFIHRVVFSKFFFLYSRYWPQSVHWIFIGQIDENLVSSNLLYLQIVVAIFARKLR